VLAPVGGDLEDRAALAQADRAEVDSHGPGLVRPLPGDGEDLLRRRVGGQVQVAGAPAEEDVPHRPADERELAAAAGEQAAEIAGGR
jgi:hypothetical protein